MRIGWAQSSWFSSFALFRTGWEHILNILCLLWNEGFLRFDCDLFVLCFSEGRLEGVHHLLIEFMRLRRFNTLIRSQHVSGEVMLSCLGIPFRCHRRTSTGNALLFVTNHVACISKPRKTRTTTMREPGWTSVSSSRTASLLYSGN